MTGYLLRRYIIRFLLILFLFCAGAFFIIARIEGYLVAKKAEIEEKASTYLKREVKIDRIRYAFPASAVISNFYIFQRDNFKEKQILNLKKVRLVFPLRALIFRSNAIISAIEAQDTSFDYHECYLLVKEHYDDIVAFIANLPKDAGFSLIFKEASLNFSSKDIFNLSFGLKISSDAIFSSGLLKIGSSLSPGLNLWQYHLKGYLTNEGIAIDNLEIMRKNFYAQLSGVAEDNILRVNGFLSLSSFWKDAPEKFEEFDVLGRLNALVKQKSRLNIIRNEITGLNLYELAAILKFNLPEIEIQKFNFILENIPFAVKGNVVTGRAATLDINSSSYPDEPPDLRAKNPAAVDLSLNGVLESAAFSGSADLNFRRSVKNKITPLNLSAEFKQVAFDLSRPAYVKIKIGDLASEYRTTDNPRKLTLSAVVASFFTRDNYLRLVSLDSEIYGGKLSGTGEINLTQMPPKCAFRLSINKAEAAKFSQLIEYFSKAEGELDAAIDYQNYPFSILKGRIDIYRGWANDFEFFKWLADFFALPALRRVNFDKASFDFLVDDKSAKMENINLSAKDVGIEGYFGISNDNLVKSVVSLRLSKEFAGSSDKLKPLIRLLGNDLEDLDFDFQLSGIFNAMNFQWLKSDFKKKIQDAIPGFIERGIERKVEEAVEGLSTTQDGGRG